MRKAHLSLLASALCAWLRVPAARADAPAPPPEAAPPNKEAKDVKIDVHAFKVVTRESGPIDYYRIVDDPAGAFIHGDYTPPTETTVLGYEIPDAYRNHVAAVHWRWRAITLPQQGDECTPDRADSAAVVYITWKRGLKWYSLKYVWSAVGPKNATCDRKRNPFRAQDTIIVESGAPIGQWRSVEIDPDKAFRYHFENGDPNAEVPKLVGIGIMSDGDETNSPSAADYGDFSLTLR
jgi:hypothetical protein